MDPYVIGLIAHFRLGLGVRLWIDDGIRIDGFSRRGNINQIDRRGQRFFDDYWRFWIGHGRTCKRRRFGACHQSGLRLLAPRAGALACLYSWSASQVVQRVCFTSSSIIATTA